MAVSLPNGVLLSLATTYGSTMTISGITNANPGVCTTSVAHSLTNGDIVEIVTTKAEHGPSRDWLGIVRTSHSMASAWGSAPG